MAVTTNCSYTQGSYIGHSAMEFEWDEAKRLSNLDKHGIDFLDVEEVF
jgi:hypothetical protein